jgi:thioredoxin-like negative regulator of GroEL
MRTPSSPTIVFWATSSLTIIGTAAVLAACWPATLAAARSQSATLTTAAGHTDGAEAEVDYRLATWLDSHNQAAYIGLARSLILAGRPDEALASLEHAGQGSEVEQLQVRTLIELGRYHQAAIIAAALTAPSRPDADLTLAALADVLADRAANAAALIPHVSSPEAAQRIARAQAGNVSLGAELYATGLLESSSALLMKLPTSYERNLLLGRIRYTRHTATDLVQATDYLTTATALNPSGLEARALLAKVYRDQNQLPDAIRQEALIAKLQSGRP